MLSACMKLHVKVSISWVMRGIELKHKVSCQYSKAHQWILEQQHQTGYDKAGSKPEVEDDRRHLQVACRLFGLITLSACDS